MRNSNYYKSDKLKPKKRTKILCDGKPTVELEWITGDKPANRRLRCSKCKKRFMTSWFDCGDGNCWHEKFPKHKYIKKV